jgi:guanylate kinase
MDIGKLNTPQTQNNKMEKTLSEKRILDQNMNGEMIYTEEDVKKHLQEFKEELKNQMENYGQFSFVIGNKDGKDIMNELIDTQMQKHFGSKIMEIN